MGAPGLAVAGHGRRKPGGGGRGLLLPAQVLWRSSPGSSMGARSVACPGLPRALMLASPLSGQPARDVLATAQQPAEVDAEMSTC